MGRGDIVVMPGEREKRKPWIVMKPTIQHHIIFLEGENPVIIALDNEHRTALPGQPLDGSNSRKTTKVEPLIQSDAQQRQRRKGTVMTPGVGRQRGETAIKSGCGNNPTNGKGLQRTNAESSV